MILEGVACDASVTDMRRTPLQGQGVQAGVGDQQGGGMPRHCRRDRNHEAQQTKKAKEIMKYRLCGRDGNRELVL